MEYKQILKRNNSQKIYSKIFEELLQKSRYTDSILFILPIEKLVIPKNINTIPILLSINLINYQLSYNITWSQDKINEQFEIFLNLLDKQSLVYIKVEENFRWNNNLFSKIWKINDECLDIKINNKEHFIILNRIWSKLFSFNIIDLRVKDTIKAESTLDIFYQILK